VDIIKALRPLGLAIRAGIHTCECEQIDGKLGGIAVHIAARVAAAAPAGGVLVSQTVKDLIAGSDIALEDRGVHRLKGIPDPSRLFAVR
jgi:class 3 adenylate cyclase